MGNENVNCFFMMFDKDRCKDCKYFTLCLKRQIELGNEKLFDDYELFD
jgi:hypothetical protein